MRRDIILAILAFLDIAYIVLSLRYGKQDVEELGGIVFSSSISIGILLFLYILSAILGEISYTKNNKVIKWLNEDPSDPTRHYDSKIRPKSIKVYDFKDIEEQLSKLFITSSNISISDLWWGIFNDSCTYKGIVPVVLNEKKDHIGINPYKEDEDFYEIAIKLIKDFNITHIRYE